MTDERFGFKNEEENNINIENTDNIDVEEAVDTVNEEIVELSGAEDYSAEKEEIPHIDDVNNENTDTYEAKIISEEEIPVSEVDTGKEKKKRSIFKTFLLVVLAAIIFGAVAGGTMFLTNYSAIKLANSLIDIPTTQQFLSKSDDTTQMESEIADIVEQCMPSVVSISNKSVTDVMTFFGTYQTENVSSGSGIIIGKNDTELLLVTNYHVVADSTELSVIFSDADLATYDAEQTEIGVKNPDVVQAQVKGYDSDKDLAVISIKLETIDPQILANIRIATIGDSSNIRAGERVVAIGNALGYGKSVTTGIISATNRSVTLKSQTAMADTVTNSFIQTDAAINPGNSGGALLNMRGELIGINSVKIAASGVEGMGYAIPITDVESIIGELMVRQTREVVDEDKRGMLGVTVQDVTSQVSQMYGMPQGVFIASVSEGSAAEKAGIKKGNIITKFDSYTVKNSTELLERLTYYKAGETVNVTVSVYNGELYESKELQVTLDRKIEE